MNNYVVQCDICKEVYYQNEISEVGKEKMSICCLCGAVIELQYIPEKNVYLAKKTV